MSVVTEILAASKSDRPIVWRAADGQDDVHPRAAIVDAACRCAAGLQQQGVEPGQIVALVMPQGIELIQAWLGCLIMGAIPTILAPPSERQPLDLWRLNLRHIVTYTRARALVHGLDLAASSAALDEPLPQTSRFISIDMLLAGDQRLDPVSTDPGQIVLLQHSSGTTGLQKGVILTNRAILLQIELYQRSIALDPTTDKIVSWLPLYHDMGLIACLLLPLITGTELVFMDNFSWALNPSMLLEAATHHRSTLCWLPNFAFNFLASRVPDAQKEPLRLDSVRMWINCSEPVRRESFEKFADAFADRGVRRGALASCYAMAENTFAVTQSTPGSPPPVTPSGDLTSSGVPLADHDLRILDEGGRELAEGELGEIHVQSPCLMDGYYRDDRRSTEVLRAGWYATGDLGMLMEGELYVSGRKKDLIILAGKNVFPEDVEQIAGEVEGVAPGRTVAFGIYADEEGTEELILLAEHPRDLDPTQAQHRQIQRAIKKEIADRLGLRAQRALLLSPRTLLKSTAGKISRSRCKTLYLEQLQADTQNPR